MKIATLRRFLGLTAYVSFLAASPALAQVGPIQPVLITEGKSETSHTRPDFDDYSVPVDVYVAADGSVTNATVTSSTGNPAADDAAVEFIRAKKFLPALDERAQNVDSLVKVTVNMFKRGTKKVVKVTLKPPAIDAEAERVRSLMCADFLWEVNRIRAGAGIRDASYEVMPYLSARMYMMQKDVSGEVENKFWDSWPGALRKIIDRCEKAQEQLFFTGVLVPALDGVMPPAMAAASH